MKAALHTFAVLLGIATISTSLAQTAPAAAPSPAATPAPAAAAAPAATTAPATASAASAPAAAPASDGKEGLATVYSDKLAGRKTASGQIFSQSKLTAAHPSLAFGTIVKVTNTKNNKTVDVRINDRGPTQAGRVIDLSSAAAAKIGIGKRSMAPVKLEVVRDAPAKKGSK